MALEPSDHMSQFLAYLASYVETHAGTARDPEEVYMLGLDSLVDILLSNGREATGLDPTFRAKHHASGMSQRTSFEPAEVGTIYERLRGFRVGLEQSSGSEIIPCVRGKRNQGLFYTPPTIVKYIVERTLDCLEISDSREYLNLKILDPAVGTGVFLAEALEQVSARVRSVIDDKGIETELSAIGRSIRPDSARQESVPERDPLIGRHTVENCLFGVDLDPTAVKIARAVLSEQVRASDTPHDLRINILSGDSLKGEATRSPIQLSKADSDKKHAAAWAHTREHRRFFHWPLEFPEAFPDPDSGFDAVIGNPPYEILSVKESGIESRRNEQAYFRRFFKSCSGKINTYRLMIERGLQLLREGGALGFIVPATLLGDSTAERLRRMILEQTTVFSAVVIPEKAKVFPGVTQALLILIVRKGGTTDKIEPVFWEGRGPIPKSSQVSIPRSVIEHMGFRVPLIRMKKEQDLLKAVSGFPRLGGDRQSPPVAQIHQGEINLTVHRDFITAEKTGYPLIRGEHVHPLCVNHPAGEGKRLDWVCPEFISQHNGGQKHTEANIPKARATAWQTERIVLARVVNMDTERRLKAAFVASGAFLGDMTNFLLNPILPVNYLLGLLNSRLLNWRMKLTSSNNYISAAEIAALPVPRIQRRKLPPSEVRTARRHFDNWISERDGSIEKFAAKLKEIIEPLRGGLRSVLLPEMIQWAVTEIQESSRYDQRDALWNLLDALVAVLYEADQFLEVFAADERR